MILSLCPVKMTSEASEGKNQLALTGTNFASWFRFLSEKNHGNILYLTQELRAVLPGFNSFSLPVASEKTRVLKVLFRDGSRSKKPAAFSFSELSDGQRQLIVLYCLLYGVKGGGVLAVPGYPDNYLALREIQPWLTSLQDAVGELDLSGRAHLPQPRGH